MYQPGAVPLPHGYTGQPVIDRVRRASREQVSFYPQLKLARLWLPLAIVGVVLFWQLVIVPLGDETWEFWSTLLFYSILGPGVTFIVLDWIATEVRLREEAQARLSSLYAELRDSHELLSGIQHVTESFASAPDLESTIKAAVRGITEVAGADGAFVRLELSGVVIREAYRLPPELAETAEQLEDSPAAGQLKPVTVGSDSWWLLTEVVGWGGRQIGVVQAWFSSQPDSRQREAFSIIAAEFSGAAEAAGARMRDVSLLVEVDRSMRAEGNLGRLLDMLLDSMLERTGASAGGIYLAEEGGLLHLRALQGRDDIRQTQPIRPGSGLIGRVAEELRPLLLNDLSQKPSAEAESRLLAGAASALVLPLHSDGMLLGVILLVHVESDHFAASGIPLLELMAGQVSWGVRNARAYLHSEELAIAEERARIAREIHDGVAQSLAFTALKLDLVERLRHRQPEKAARELEVSRDTIREMIREVRRSIFALRPIDLERHGFAETIRRYSLDFGQQNDVNVQVDVQPVEHLTLKSETILFRIFQEAMNNVAKHAQASNVMVLVGETGSGEAFVEVRDDGIGFDLEKVTDRVSSMGGLGLKQMRERVGQQGGRFSIVTAEGAGTTVRAELPA